MAHALAFIGEQASMAYRGATPWHGLGQVMQDGMSLDQWRVAAGLDWEAKKQKVGFWEDNTFRQGDSNILYRSDNLKELGIVSDDYKVLQPKAVLEFYRDLVADHGFELETAGALHDGKRIWALARTGKDFRVAGTDLVEGYCLLANTPVDKETAVRFIMELMAPEVDKDGISTRKLNQVNDVVGLFTGRGMGSDLRSAKGTMWGLVNAVTEYVDHHAGRSQGTRLNSAWFGQGAELKTSAFDKALALAA